MATKKEKEQKIIEMLGKHKTTMLITQDEQGGLVSRPMTTQKSEFDGDVWFFVSSDADVIKEIEANPRVNISYSIKKNFVSVSGEAKMVDDDEKKKELWYPELKKWFNGEGPESSHVRLIKVSATSARYWDMSNGDSKSSKDDKKKKEESPIDSGIVKF